MTGPLRRSRRRWKTRWARSGLKLAGMVARRVQRGESGVARAGISRTLYSFRPGRLTKKCRRLLQCSRGRSARFRQTALQGRREAFDRAVKITINLGEAARLLETSHRQGYETEGRAAGDANVRLA